MEETCKKALKTFGLESQLRMLQEEAAELIVAIHHKYRGRVDDDTLLEEIADVEIMLSQVKQAFSIGQFEKLKAKKLRRLQALINKHSDENHSYNSVPKLRLVRGLPGSGKSTRAQQLSALGYVHVEADQFFMVDGRYEFDTDKLGENHAKCKSLVDLLLQSGHDVVVANTFTTEAEVRPYRMIAKHNGAELEIESMENNYGSIHDVPEEAIARMRKRWEDIKE